MCIRVGPPVFSAGVRKVSVNVLPPRAVHAAAARDVQPQHPHQGVPSLSALPRSFFVVCSSCNRAPSPASTSSSLHHPAAYPCPSGTALLLIAMRAALLLLLLIAAQVCHGRRACGVFRYDEQGEQAVTPPRPGRRAEGGCRGAMVAPPVSPRLPPPPALPRSTKPAPAAASTAASTAASPAAHSLNVHLPHAGGECWAEPGAPAQAVSRRRGRRYSDCYQRRPQRPVPDSRGQQVHVSVLVSWGYGEMLVVPAPCHPDLPAHPPSLPN